MKRLTIGMALLAALATSQMGCGSTCERAEDRIIHRYEDCEISASSSSSSSGAVVCSAADGEYLECRATCVEAASCESLKGTDFEGGVDFGKCNADCENQ